MMRALWRLYVNGHPYMVAGLFGGFVANVLADAALWLQIYWGVLLALNLYSYDYQRRRAAGRLL